MSDTPQEPTATWNFEVEFLRKGKHSAVICLPPDYHAPLGLVIAHWANFEDMFSGALGGLIDAEQRDGGTRDTAGWNRQPFRRRKRLFKAICKEWVAQWKPEQAKELGRIVDRAADLGHRRNILAHGIYRFTMPPKSSLATNCRATSTETGEELPITVRSLKKLYHDIAHITAEFWITVTSFARIAEGPIVAFPDTYLLQAYRDANRQSRPTDSTP